MPPPADDPPPAIRVSEQEHSLISLEVVASHEVEIEVSQQGKELET